MNNDYENVKIVKKPFECNGSRTLFGRRWNGEVITIGQKEIEALRAGKLLAIDVNAEYVIFVKESDDEE